MKVFKHPRSSIDVLISYHGDKIIGTEMCKHYLTNCIPRYINVDNMCRGMTIRLESGNVICPCRADGNILFLRHGIESSG